ncbi:MAG: DNA polymerase III subunit delta', partial [Pseudomonadota bacterium]
LLARLARFGALQTPVWTEAAPHEARAFAALAPNPGRARRWADLAAEVGARTGHGRAVNIDPATVVLDALLAIDGAARGA